MKRISAQKPAKLASGTLRYVKTVRSLIPGEYRVRSAATIILAVSPPIICLLVATGPDRWHLFERSGSLTAAIGFLLASRQYLKPGTIELAIKNRKHDSKSNMVELAEDIHSHKLGLAISAFGSIIMGWGSYLRWWTFGYLVVWAAISAYDAWRDFVRLRDTPIADPSAEQAPWSPRLGET